MSRLENFKDTAKLRDLRRKFGHPSQLRESRGCRTQDESRTPHRVTHGVGQRLREPREERDIGDAILREVPHQGQREGLCGPPLGGHGTHDGTTPKGLVPLSLRNLLFPAQTWLAIQVVFKHKPLGILGGASRRLHSLKRRVVDVEGHLESGHRR